MLPVLMVRNLRLIIGSNAELRIDYADFERGRLHLISGPNGSGKSSFLRAILGFKPLVDGVVTWSSSRGIVSQVDCDTRQRPPKSLFQNVGYVQQGRGSLWPQYTVREHISIAAGRAFGGSVKIPDAERKRDVAAILRRALVPEKIWDSRPVAASDQGRTETFSGGEEQRVAFARALAGSPEVLVMDEPDSSLDLLVKGLLIQSIRVDFLHDIADRTVFVVTHNQADWTLDIPGVTAQAVHWQIKRSGDDNCVTLCHASK